MANLLDGFYRMATSEPRRVAFTVGARDFSYGALLLQVQATAAWLRQQGLVANSRVGILSARNHLAFEAILATLWVGACYVPLNVKMPLARLQSMIDRIGLSALVMDEAGAMLLSDGLVLADKLAVLEGAADDDSFVAARKSAANVDAAGTDLHTDPLDSKNSDAAYVMFTSGTTGAPKAILVTFGNLRAYLSFQQQRYQINSADRLSQLFELSFDASVFDFLMALNHGASFHVVPDNQIMAPAKFIRDKQLTLWFGVPSTIAFMDKMKLLVVNSLPTLRLAIFGGEPLPVSSLRAWQRAAPDCVVDNVYGPTEATVTCFVQRCAEPLRVTPGRDVVAIGKPYTGTFGAILDEQGIFLPRGSVGEIAIAGDQVATGYVGEDSLTEEKFVNLVHPEYGYKRWYRTGDLGSEDANGTFHHLGRFDNQVKVLGYRVELEDVEAWLRRVSGLDGVAVIPFPVEAGSAKGLVAFIAGEVDVQQVRTALQAHVPSYMVPKRICIVAELPQTLNGKVDRKKLAALLEQE